MLIEAQNVTVSREQKLFSLVINFDIKLTLRKCFIEVQRGATVIFSSTYPKGYVHYYHQFAYVVCKLFPFRSSSPQPLDPLEPNMIGMFIRWYFIEFEFFGADHKFNMAA